MLKAVPKGIWLYRLSVLSLLVTAISITVAAVGLRVDVLAGLAVVVLSLVLVNYFRARMTGREANFIYLTIGPDDDYAELADLGFVVLSVFLAVVSTAKALPGE
jgi:hypothetical protein